MVYLVRRVIFMSIEEKLRKLDEELREHKKKSAEQQEKIKLNAEEELEELRVKHENKIKEIDSRKKVYDFETRKVEVEAFLSKKSVKIISKTIFWLIVSILLILSFFYFAVIYLIAGFLIIYLLMRIFY